MGPFSLPDDAVRWVAVASTLAAALGCSGSEEGGAGGSSATTGSGGGGGQVMDGCPPGEVTETDGSCRPAGVPPAKCGSGFEADERGGCVAILPSEPCAAGAMALPGETRCREVAPCGDEPFGDAPDEATTQYVDASYLGADSDGSKAKPWTTIQDGVYAASPGAVVAVAEGTYASFQLTAAVTVMGRCPSMVEVAGPPNAETVGVFADGVTVKNVAIRGEGFGFASFADEVTVANCWVHDTELVGVYAGAGSVTLIDSLVERTGEVGCGALGASVTIERSVLREGRPNGAGMLGIGVVLQPDDTGKVGTLEVRGSLIADNSDHGVLVAEGDATIESSVIRGTKPRASDDIFGRGLAIVDESPDDVAELHLEGSVLEKNHDVAVFVGAASATIVNTSLRETQPLAGGVSGRGIEAQWWPATGGRPTVDVRDSIIDRSTSQGALLLDADAVFAGVVIRDIAGGQLPEGLAGRGLEALVDDEDGQPSVVRMTDSVVTGCTTLAMIAHGSQLDVDRTAIVDNGAQTGPERGGGITFQDQLERGVPSRGTLRDSLLQRDHGASVVVIGSEVTIERTQVLDTLPASDGFFGRGVIVQDRVENGLRGKLTMTDGVVRGSYEVGVLVVDSDATLQRVTVSDSLADANGVLGDGVAVVTLAHGAVAILTDCRLEHNARAGVSSFGSSVVLTGTALECNAIHLDGEAYSGMPFALSDSGGNTCGCAGETTACAVITSMLAPPAAL